MLMYNMLEHSDNYSLTWGSLWKYYKDEVNDAAKEIVADHKINNGKTTTASRSFKHKKKKTKILGRTSDKIIQ